MNDVAASQQRLTAAKVAVGMFVYAEGQWVRVVDVHTAAGVTEVYLVGHADPIEYRADEDVDVCLPLGPS